MGVSRAGAGSVAFFLLLASCSGDDAASDRASRPGSSVGDGGGEAGTNEGDGGSGVDSGSGRGEGGATPDSGPQQRTSEMPIGIPDPPFGVHEKAPPTPS